MGSSFLETLMLFIWLSDYFLTRSHAHVAMTLGISLSNCQLELLPRAQLLITISEDSVFSSRITILPLNSIGIHSLRITSILVTKHSHLCGVIKGVPINLLEQPTKQFYLSFSFKTKF